MIDEKITRLPIRTKDPKRLLSLAPPSSCQHRKTVIDEKLAEIECADCGAKLNPMWVLGQFARQLMSWDWEYQRIVDARRQLEERKQTCCLHCGRMTEIRPVPKWERRRIRGRKEPAA